MNTHCCGRNEELDTVSEKYLADELTPAARQSFEQHFITCPQCWERLQFTGEMLRTSRFDAQWLRRRIYPRTAPGPRVAAPQLRETRPTLSELAKNLGRLRKQLKQAAASVAPNSSELTIAA